MVVHNPNNWHWVDKNCIDWTRTYFSEKLTEISAQTETPEKKPVTVKITKVKSCEGDVDVCQRKGKVISLFDLKLVVNYEGEILDNEGDEPKYSRVGGDITVPEIAYDSEEDDYQFEITTLTGQSTKEKDFIKTQVRQLIIPKLRKALAIFGTDLLKEHGSEIQHPLDQVQSNFTKSNQVESAKLIQNKLNKETSGEAGSTSSSSSTSNTTTTANGSAKSEIPIYNTESATTEMTCRAPASEVYETFTDKSRVAAWSRSPPKYTKSLDSSEEVSEPSVGTAYSLFGGNITGEFLSLEKGKLIKQTWRLKEWKAGHYATLTLALEQNENETTVKVKFDGIPVGQVEDVLDNFNQYYTKPIMITFGYGSVL